MSPLLLSLPSKVNWGCYESKKIKQQVRETRDKILNPIERRPQYDSDNDVIGQAVKHFYDEFKKRRIL